MRDLEQPRPAVPRMERSRGEATFVTSSHPPLFLIWGQSQMCVRALVASWVQRPVLPARLRWPGEENSFKGFYFPFVLFSSADKGLRAPGAPRGAVPGASPGSGGTRGAEEPPKNRGSPPGAAEFPTAFPAAPLIRRTPRAGTPGGAGWVSAPCPPFSPPPHPPRPRRARRGRAGPARAARCGPSAR